MPPTSRIRGSLKIPSTSFVLSSDTQWHMNAMNNILRISPTVVLRLLPSSYTPPPAHQELEPELDPSPKIGRPLNQSRPRPIFVDIPNKGVALKSPDSGPSTLAPSPVFVAPGPFAGGPISRPVFGDLVNSMNANNDVPLSALYPTPPLTPQPPGPFLFIKHLQLGGFAETIVVRELGHRRGWSSVGGRVLCLKVFRKEDVLKRRLLPGVLRELVAYKQLASVEKVKGSIFVMELEGSMQDEDRLFFAMRLMSCDILGVLNGDGPERKKNARRWLAQAAAGLSSIHSSGIIHRDIKPENLLVDTRGNIRITDFGTAYTHWSGDALHPWGEYSDEVVGTMQYMAPEVLENRNRSREERWKYGVAVDYWGLGCVAYELEAEDEKCLFATEEELSAYTNWSNLMHGGQSYLSFAGLSEQAEALISGLLRINPMNRFGIADLRRQPYFQNENGRNEFENIESRALCRRPVEIDVRDDYEEALVPPAILSPRIDAPFRRSDSYTFDNIGWINPKGIWGQRAPC